MNYLALIRQKEREISKHILKETRKDLRESVQDETNETNETTPWRGEEGDGPLPSPRVVCVTPLSGNPQPSDIVIEPADVNAKPIFWERVSTGDILGPAQVEFFATVGTGPSARYWFVVQFEGLPIWVNSIQLRSRRQFNAQARPAPPVVECIPQMSTVKHETIVVEQPLLEFPDEE